MHRIALETNFELS